MEEKIVKKKRERDGGVMLNFLQGIRQSSEGGRPGGTGKLRRGLTPARGTVKDFRKPREERIQE